MKYLALKDITINNGEFIYRGNVFHSEQMYPANMAVEIEEESRVVLVDKEREEVEEDVFKSKASDKEEVKDRTFICPICKKVHRIDSKIGIKHLEEVDSGTFLRKQDAIKNLKDFDKILRKLNIDFWLEHGTLLGAYRDKDFCEGDEDDIDLGTWASKYKKLIPKILEACYKKGFSLYHQWDVDGKAPQICVKRNESHIDLFFFEKKKIDAYSCLYGCGRIVPYVVKAKYLSKFKEISFKGIKVNIPFDIKNYLTAKYGDWKIKISAKEYRESGGCYNPDNLRPINPNYKM